jgi:hypothetical protein
MSDYLKLLIRNPDTNEQLWFEYPFDMDEIRETLHIKGDGYTVIDSNSSAPVYEYDSIKSIVEDYNEYLLLPDYIKRNINKILDVVDGIGDIFNAVTEKRVAIYENCKDKYDLARELLRERGDVPEDIIDYIDSDRYIYDVTINSNIIETPDGVIEIRY